MLGNNTFNKESHIGLIRLSGLFLGCVSIITVHFGFFLINCAWCGIFIHSKKITLFTIFILLIRFSLQK